MRQDPLYESTSEIVPAIVVMYIITDLCTTVKTGE